MAIHIQFSILISLTISPLFTAFASDEIKIPKFAFSWLDDKYKFQAGEIATIKIKVLGNFDEGNGLLKRSDFNPRVSVNGKMGNSCYISGVFLDLKGDFSTWKILFTTIMVGLFNVIVSEDRFRVLDSSLHFQVQSARAYPSSCVATWVELANEFEAGREATLLILPRDAFGNNISSTAEDPSSHNFTLSALLENGSIATVPNITKMSWSNFGYITVEFIVTKAGNFFLHVQGGNQTLNGSPLPLKVNPGLMDVSSCKATWNVETTAWQLFSRMEVFIHQQDRYGNLVQGLYLFDAEVVEKDSNLSIPVADLHFEEVEPGIQLLSYPLLEPENFLLTIFDMEHNKSISNMPYAYTVFIGYCDGLKSVINGSGLNNSVAGNTSEFSVILNDVYQYPSPIEVEHLQVQILQKIDFSYVQPIIRPKQNINGSGTIEEISDSISLTDIAPAPFLVPNNTSTGSSKIQASAFDVIYTAQKSGIFEIRVSCGNILLNGGYPIIKEVRAGEVNISHSGVVKFAPRVPKLTKNEIVVQLLDSFYNPVLSQQSRLKLEVASINTSGFSSWMFEDNNDGSYSGHYLAKDVGTYEICASFDGNRFLPCPFGVNVYSSEYFPKAYDDAISVWEDESIAFDILANDYFAGNNASITEFANPGHGSLLQYGQLLRYTPQKGFYGNDSFLYTTSDVNGNTASAAVNISILKIPPQFVSFPSQLQATEDVMSPRFGGFSGFEIRYSDLMENICVTVSARSGTVFLAPMLMQFWQPMWSEFSVRKGGEEEKEIILEGCLEVINFALQSIQYLGDENFCGEDIIRISTRNENGINELNVTVTVEPINDPPFIHVPEFIMLKSNEDESLIFDREIDKFEFSIGDPDLGCSPGGGSQFLVTFSMEVSDGYLVTSLPAGLINTTELKSMNSYQWQSLQTYVTISKHFTVMAYGVRFRGTVNNCNSILQQLLYRGGDHDAVLTLTLTDNGLYGCSPDCAEKVSVPLYAEATVNLIRRMPMSSLVAHTLGSAIFIEFVMVFSLGMLLLFFMCKCALHLVKERRSREIRNPIVQSSRKQNVQSEAVFFKDATHFTGCCSSPCLLGSQPSNIRPRSQCEMRSGESSTP